MAENKTVKINTKEEKKKLSYEELEAFAYQLSEQSKQLKKTLNERDEIIKKLQNDINNFGGAFTRMQFLIEVIKHSNVKFNESFANKCAEEFEHLMEIPEEQTEEKVEEE